VDASSPAISIARGSIITSEQVFVRTREKANMSNKNSKMYPSGEPVDFHQVLQEERRKAQPSSLSSKQQPQTASLWNPAISLGSGGGDVDEEDEPNNGKVGAVLKLVSGESHSYEEQHSAIDFMALLREERRKARLLKASTSKKQQDAIVSSIKHSPKTQNQSSLPSSSNERRQQPQQPSSRLRQNHPVWPPATSSSKENDDLKKQQQNPLSFKCNLNHKQYLISSQPSRLYYVPNIWNDMTTSATNDTTSSSPSSPSSIALWNWLDALPHDDSGMEAWKTLKYGKRRVAMMEEGRGGGHDTKDNDADVDRSLSGPLQDIANFLIQTGVFPADTPPNHVLLNDYFDPTQGILPHTDGPMYAPRTATLSLGRECPVILTFTPRRREEGKDEKEKDEKEYHSHAANGMNGVEDVNDGKKTIEMVLHPESLVIFQDDLYTDYCHGIEMIKNNSLNNMEDDDDDTVVEVTSIHCLNAPPNTRIVRGARRMSLTFRHKYS
jgi:hypothetical protein